MRIIMPRLLSIGAALAILAVATAKSASTEAGAVRNDNLNSTYFDWRSVVMKPTKEGYRCGVVDSPTRTFDRLVITVVTLNPGGATTGPIRHPQEEIVLVKEGNLDLALGTGTWRVAAGSLIFLAAEATHSLSNMGPSPATYYVLDVFTGARSTTSVQAATGLLDSGTYNPETLPSKPTPVGSSCWFIDSPTRTFKELVCHTTTLNPGAGMPAGHDGADEFTVVESGIIQSTINGVSCRLAAGSFFLQASNDLHANRNIGATPATYLVVKIVTDKTPQTTE
jgi:quercetin dioxygenase-like cupin family protein